MSEKEKTQQCGVCGVILYRSPVGYVHGAEHLVPAHRKDHPAVPVDYDERNLVSHCDFCGAITALDDRQLLEVGDFVLCAMEVGTDKVVPIFENTGPYMACPPCAAHIEKGDWEGLTDYVIKNHPPKHPDFLIAMVEAVKTNMKAPIRPWRAGDENSGDWKV